MSEPTELMHVSTTLSRGGAENHVAELVRDQRSRGAAVTVAYLRGSGGWTDELVRLGAEVHNLELKFYGDLPPLLKLRRLIKRKHPLLLHAHMPPAELYTRLALLGTPRGSLPLVITKHNQEPFYPGPFHAPLGRLVARRASAVIAISEAVRRYVTGPGLGLPAAQVETIHYGINAKPFCEVSDAAALDLRREWEIPDEALLIGFVGRFVPQKSLDTLLTGFARFKASCGDNIRLALVGTGPLGETLRRQAKELGIADDVVWPGFREDVPIVMRAFDIFVLPSVYEGLGLVLLEAMAAGRPVVASRTGAIPEVVIDEVTGLLVTVANPDELSQAFARLSEPGLRSRFGKAGRERVLETFTLEEMHRRTHALYSRIQRDRLD
jgi:glycosyltransferase involved in cell wall biosynthesis